MESDLLKQQDATASDSRGWGIAALVVSIGANTILANFAFTYFSILRQGMLLGSYLDSRGGFSEMGSIVPVLVGAAVIGGAVAVRCNVWKRFAIYSSLTGIGLVFLCFILMHYLRTSLR